MKSLHASSAGPKGFTLAELLVVIGIMPMDIYNHCTQSGNTALNIPATTAIDYDWWNWFKN